MRQQVYIDWTGEIQLSDTEPKASKPRHHDDSAMFVDTDYDVDTEPFTGARKLDLKDQAFCFLVQYTRPGGVVIFCKPGLVKVFGQVPQTIYYKEV